VVVVLESAALTGAAGFFSTTGLFDLTELADDGLQASLLAGKTADSSTEDTIDNDGLFLASASACATDSSVALLVSSAKWSFLTSVACLTGGVGRSTERGCWLDAEGGQTETVDLKRAVSARRFTLLSTTFDCVVVVDVVVVSGFLSTDVCAAGFTRDAVVQADAVVDDDETRLDEAGLLFTDECLLVAVAGITTVGFSLGLVDVVSALAGLLLADTTTTTGLDLTALDGRLVFSLAGGILGLVNE